MITENRGEGTPFPPTPDSEDWNPINDESEQILGGRWIVIHTSDGYEIESQHSQSTHPLKSTDIESTDVSALRAEVQRLREREKLCETMDKAEKLALIRALQEIRDEVGLLGDGVTPRQIVEAVRVMKRT